MFTLTQIEGIVSKRAYSVTEPIQMIRQGTLQSLLTHSPI